MKTDLRSTISSKAYAPRDSIDHRLLNGARSPAGRVADGLSRQLGHPSSPRRAIFKQNGPRPNVDSFRRPLPFDFHVLHFSRSVVSRTARDVMDDALRN